ncbi:MAG: cysteine synthase family protein [Ruminococcus sp.]|nr:cysteine synthase family protein [Ruminococcus sp.]
MDILNTGICTPLFELKSFGEPERGVKVFGKGEFLNISGSVKDRAAKAMIKDGLKKGLLTKDKTIIDATSGNTGIAYAMLGAALGIRVKLYMPGNVTEERRRMMRAFGAQTVLTSPLEGMEGAYKAVNYEVDSGPEKYFYPDQYTNPKNWQAHYDGTALEILEQTGGRLTHFVSGTGTSGTFMGCTKRFKETDPGIVCCNMTPDSPFHGIEGVKYERALLELGFYDPQISDGSITVTTETAYEYTRRLSRQEGLFVGISAGANVAAAQELARTAPDGSVIVTVLCDVGCRYLSTGVWDG